MSSVWDSGGRNGLQGPEQAAVAFSTALAGLWGLQCGAAVCEPRCKMKCHCPVVGVQAGRQAGRQVSLRLVPPEMLNCGAHRRRLGFE